MAFEELGSKIMIHKVTEYSKDVSSLQRSGELAQSALQAKAAAEDQRQTQQIQDIYEPSEAIVGRQRGKREDARKRQAPKDRGQKKKDALMQDGPQKIDIEI